MGFATHLGPWLLGTVKNTTGTTAGTIRNMGATVVSQSGTMTFATTSATQLCVLPAGAQIINIFIDTLVAFTGSTAANVVVGTSATTNLFWASSDITAQGRLANTNAAAKLVNWCGATSTASPNGIGIGSTDVIVQAVLTPTVADVTAGTVQYTVVYAVADSTGIQSPASA